MVHRLFWRTGFIFTALLILSNSTTVESNADMKSNLHFNEFLKPLNERLANERTSFPGSETIDQQITRFMETSNITGVSVAIVKDERLVYTNAFGFANREEGIKTTPEHLFRVASVSKLITAVAIMALIDDGKLSLQSKVFGPNGIINDEKYYNATDPSMHDITVKDLLDHGGGWTQRYGDPMFNPILICELTGQQPPATLDTYLNFVSSRRLHFKPGTASSYSNMGYVFLGEVIKRISGMEYEDFVKSRVLLPLGLFDMHIGASYQKDKRKNEVVYYEHETSDTVLAFNGSGEFVRRAYGGNNIELLGAAGGWIASAPELARLLVAIDGFDDKPDLVSKESIVHMTESTERPLGWRDIKPTGEWYRTGTLAGTSAMLMRRPDGIEWVVLCNSSNWRGPHLTYEIARTMNRIVNQVKEWPTHDLFYHLPSELIAKKTP